MERRRRRGNNMIMVNQTRSPNCPAAGRAFPGRAGLCAARCRTRIDGSVGCVVGQRPLSAVSVPPTPTAGAAGLNRCNMLTHRDLGQEGQLSTILWARRKVAAGCSQVLVHTGLTSRVLPGRGEPTVFMAAVFAGLNFFNFPCYVHSPFGQRDLRACPLKSGPADAENAGVFSRKSRVSSASTIVVPSAAMWFEGGAL
jgi:hypothetical protein